MASGDFIHLHASSGSCSNNYNKEWNNCKYEAQLFDTQLNRYTVEGEVVKTEVSVCGIADGKSSNEQHSEGTSLGKDVTRRQSILEGNAELIETVTDAEKIVLTKPARQNENDCLISQETSTSGGVVGHKRAQPTNNDEQPLVHVTYVSLPRQSKSKLEELLYNWSEWHAQQCFAQDSIDVLESGEETYYPALHVGSEKSSTVSFLMDSGVSKKHCKDLSSLDSKPAPFYNRDYSFGLTSLDGSSGLEGGSKPPKDSRCFNCGSYSHSLKECSKPRDNVAVNNARKEYSTKRNHAGGPRVPTRYYHDTPGGKYDGLKPGVLCAESRKILGLGEMDPPPWLNRMRELGYPPGYLDSENDEQPSGISIYADEETEKELNADNNHRSDISKSRKKMSVDFPGINAPIPENADKRKWAAATGHKTLTSPSNKHINRAKCAPEHVTAGQSRDQRWSRDYGNGGYPGYNSAVSPPGDPRSPYYNGFSPRYSGDYPSHGGGTPMLSPGGMSFNSHYSGRSPSAYEDSHLRTPHGYFPHSPTMRPVSSPWHSPYS